MTTTDPFRRTDGIHTVIASNLTGFGGILRCTKCGGEQPVGNIGGIADSLASGWPECCGYTMTWMTARQLAEEKAAKEASQ